MTKTSLSLFLGIALAVAAQAQQDSVVVFNEVMYHPPGTAVGAEWIELHNQNAVDVDISGWSLRGGVEFIFPKGTVILGSGYVVIANAAGTPTGALGPWQGQLDNDGEELRLHNNSGRVMSLLDYRDGGRWPVAADGSGMTLAKRDPDTLSSDAANWTWSGQTGGTPGAANFPAGLPSTTLAWNELAGASEASFWVELKNTSKSAVNLLGHRVRSSVAGVDYVFPEQSLAAGAYLVLDLARLAFPKVQDGERLYLMTPDGGAVLDAVEIQNTGRARLPDGTGRWMASTRATAGQANAVALRGEIVISEIMYHYRPTYENEVVGQPYAENPEEWIELYNKSATAVDLTGWSLAGGMAFAFPDNTKLEANSYLVVANDKAKLVAKYPSLRVLGDFSGRLNNGSDRIVLQEPNGNPADEVTYHDNGRWPSYADGLGSSLELRDVNADSNVAESWGASDEGRKSEWKQYTYSGLSVKPPGTAFPTQWSEFNMGLLDEGEFLIDDISAIEEPNGAGRVLLKNGSFAGAPGSAESTASWRFRGTHGVHARTRTVADPNDAAGSSLHVVASGPTEHMHNQVETTLAAGPKVVANKEYRISFRAKWLAGSPRLTTRLYFAWMQRTNVMAMPTKHGTPGEKNSIAVENLGPALNGFQHSPAVPKPDQPIRVTVAASDADGLESVILHWSLDGADASSTAMSLADDGRYAAEISGKAAATKVLFYVEAKDKKGAINRYPSAGFAGNVLCIVDDGKALAAPPHNIRILLPAATISQMHAAVEVMSNHRFPCTVIYREQEVFYGCGIRIKGSERGRPTAVRLGYSIQFPGDHLFRGLQATMAVDRSGAGDEYSQKEILINHAINAAGHIPGQYDDLVHLIAPQPAQTGSAMLVPRFNDVLLDSLFENGADGKLFEYELIYFPTTATGGAEGPKRPSPDSVAGVAHRSLGEDKEPYRHHYLIKNHRAEDDYSGIMNWCKVMGLPQGAEYQQKLKQTMEVDQWLRAFIIQSLFGVGDNYSSGAQHNMMIYIRPDGKVLYVPWDMDFTFSQAATSTLASNTDLAKMLAADGANFRSFYAQANEILDTVVNGPYMDRWVQHYDAYLPKASFTSFGTYIKSRYTAVKKEINTKFPKVPFAITTNEGNDHSVTSPTATVEGKGWIDVKWIRVDGVNYQPLWVGRDTWRLTVPLRLGANALAFQGLDYNGSPGSESTAIGADTITITHTGRLEAATAGNLAITEFMYHPLGASAEEKAAGFADQDMFEFIELANIGANPIDLTGARFSEGVAFDFTNAKVKELAAGQRLVIVANEAAFLKRYGNAAVIAGAYTDNLRNSGEEVRLRSAVGAVIAEFTYEDEAPWPTTADGQGYSLTLRSGAGDPTKGDAWAASGKAGGSPGAGETAPTGGYAEWIAARGGEGLADPNGDGYELLLDYALGADLAGKPIQALLPQAGVVLINGKPHATLSYTRRTNADVTYAFETSSNLQIWNPASMVNVSSSAGAEVSQVVVRTATELAAPQYFRLKVKAP